MGNFKRLVSAALAIAILACQLPANLAQASNKTLTILHTNDVHGNAVGDKFGEEKSSKIGLEKYKVYVEKTRKEVDNVLVFDVGDFTHGTSFATISRGESMVKLANLIGFNGFVPGNHDFNYGFARMKELEKMAKYPFLAANLIDTATGKPAFKDNEIIDLDGYKVGIFGMATKETKTKSNPVNTQGIEFADEYKTAEEQVKILKDKGAKMIIMLSHLGMDEVSNPTSEMLAKKVRGIDLIIDGHSHSKFEEGYKAGDTLIVSAHEHLKNIGRVDVVLGDKPEIKARLIPFAEAAGVEEVDKDAEALIKSIQDANKPYLEAIVGKTKTDLVGERAVVRTGESNLGQLLTDAMLKETGADVAITNGGGIRATIKAGDITREAILTAFPFTNYPVVLEAKGSDIIKALEYGLDSYPEVVGKFPHTAGMTFEIVPLQPKGAIVQNVKIAGQDLEMDKVYKLTTNDFMSVGGDGYEMFKGLKKISEHPLLSEVLEKYIAELTKEKGEINVELVKRMTVADKLEGAFERLSGKDRYETALKISKDAFEKAETVILVSGQNYADSLSAAGLADQKKAPILLADGEKVSEDLAGEIKRLGAKEVIIVGGEKSVSKAIETELAKSLKVSRLAGKDRYDTSLEVYGKTYDKDEKLIFASGENSADALAVSSIAYRDDLSVLLVGPKGLSEKAAKAVKDHKYKEAYVVGGEVSINTDALKTIQESVAKVERIAGVDRFETASKIADKFYPEAKSALIADGVGFADALTVAPLFDKYGGPLLLVRANLLPEATANYIEAKGIKEMRLIGGPASVSEGVHANLIRLAK